MYACSRGSGGGLGAATGLSVGLPGRFGPSFQHLELVLWEFRGRWKEEKHNNPRGVGSRAGSSSPNIRCGAAARPPPMRSPPRRLSMLLVLTSPTVPVSSHSIPCSASSVISFHACCFFLSFLSLLLLDAPLLTVARPVVSRGRGPVFVFCFRFSRSALFGMKQNGRC